MAGEGTFPKDDGDIAFASDFNRMDILIKTVSWTTSFSTDNTSFIDVTDATATLTGMDSTKTYIIFAIINPSKIGANAQGITVRVVIDGVANTIAAFNSPDSESFPVELHGIKTGVTSTTSIVAKLQIKTDTGTVTVNASNETARITILAFPQ